MPTIKEVAQAANTSIATVSKALNGSYTISEETTERIRRVAQEMGYQPNARAQTFARKETHLVAFMANLPRNVAFDNPHMFEMVAGAESALAQKGYSLLLKDCDEHRVRQMAETLIDGKAVDGLLLHASVINRDISAMLTKREIPHIVIGKPQGGGSLCWIDNNNELAGELASRHLLALGHRQIVFVGGQEEDRISEDRLTGAKRECSGLQVLRADPTIAEGKRAGLALLQMDNRPTAVICANNYLAYGVLRAFQWEKVSVPEDMSLITFDDYPFAQFLNPALTTVSIDVYEMGIQAAKLLLSKIRKPNIQIQTFTTVANLVERASTTAI
jgi:DNA-binding LacI/PurR family transcriptional regulator